MGNINFDKQQIFEKEIKPALDHLQTLLCHYEMPYFFAAAVKTDGCTTEYIYDCHDIWSVSAKMADDKIPSFINVANGFKTVLPDECKTKRP